MERISQRPLSFVPYLKAVVWGGNELYRIKGVPFGVAPIGESWELSDLAGRETVVASGPYAGLTLHELIGRFGESLLGSKATVSAGMRFPLLIKFIDAHRNLSMQVHPDDNLARRRNLPSGKTEMWYVIDTKPGATIYSGFRELMDADGYRRHVADGTFADTVAKYDSHPGDLFFIPGGRVHAIGAGNLVVEIQQSSDITYRIYDYGRLDADGRPRELHTELAAEALDFNVQPDYRQHVGPSSPDEESELVACSCFNVGKIDLQGEMLLKNDGSSFIILVCVGGNCKVTTPEETVELGYCQTLLLPASICATRLRGRATLLTARL